MTRHAEKQSNSADPLLTTCGQQRAMLLADTLRNVEIQAVYSTSYQRTLATARPTANAKKISVTQYAPNGLEQLARVLKQKQLNTLVVGHSNTTPMLLSLLTGKSFDKISEDNFRHLYQVIITTDQSNEITHMVVTDLTQSLKCS
ncbi:histidine phosphatase family protein [Thalassotalea euphylliae]|uniref:histidine phosphatase family protein n=1 Tax=Thalassotalea euphylliae TaxID=1655234 RepID=UPI0015F25116|nr:histidine phosphatase family protein [Thalassotalea euphylliae]